MNMNMDLVFKEETHQYFVGQQELPSVTTVLQEVTDFSRIPPATLERARIRGIAVHRATELDDMGTLDPATVHPIIQPYLDAYRKFKRQMKFEPIHIEQRVCNLTWNYAGTLDRIGRFDKGVPILLDLKARSYMSEEIGPQLAAYSEAWLAETGEDLRDHRYSLQLKPDGNYQLERYDNERDISAFLGALAIFNWRKSL